MTPTPRLLRILALIGVLVFPACGDTPREAPSSEPRKPAPASSTESSSLPPVAEYTNIAEQAGLTLRNTCGREGKPAIHLLETIGQGVGILDYDQDGWMDIYLVNGGDYGATHPRNALYRNLGGLRFQDVTSETGVGDGGWGIGVAVGDCDNDGDPDLYVTNWGPNRLFRNDGRGSFENVPRAGGASGTDETSSSAAFTDLDGDGLLDLYVANYVFTDPVSPPGRTSWQGIQVVKGPLGLTAEPDRIYRNLGDCRFEDVSMQWLPQGTAPAYALGVVSFDFDADGDMDVLVANDSQPNYLFRNQGKGRLEEIGMASGFALSEDGRDQAGMGIAAGDADGDGRLDVAITNFSLDNHSLYLNKPQGWFDVSAKWGLGFSTRVSLGWGVAFLDFDSDGREDLFISNGHIYPEIQGTLDYVSYPQLDQLFHNEGDRFQEVTRRAGPAFREARVSRGSATVDLDNDGALEIVQINHQSLPALLVNRRAPANDWIGFDLQPEAGQSTPVGTRIWIETGAGTQVRELVAGGSYASSPDPRLLFGIPEGREIRGIRVRWPSGRVEELATRERSRYWRLRPGVAPGS